jgi:hypothetical protein
MLPAMLDRIGPTGSAIAVRNLIDDAQNVFGNVFDERTESICSTRIVSVDGVITNIHVQVGLFASEIGDLAIIEREWLARTAARAACRPYADYVSIHIIPIE